MTRKLISVLALLAAMVLAILLAPTAAALTMLRSDSSLHGALKWMLTTDNSIDALWQQPHHLQSYSWLKNVDPREFERSAWLRCSGRRPLPCRWSVSISPVTRRRCWAGRWSRCCPMR